MPNPQGACESCGPRAGSGPDSRARRKRASAASSSIRPPALGGAARGPRPGEVVLMALASCQEHTYRVHAALLGIPLEDIRVELEGLVDGRGFLGDESVAPGFSEVRGTVTIKSGASQDELDRLQEAVDRHCPVLDDLRRPVPVTLRLRNRA